MNEPTPGRDRTFWLWAVVLFVWLAAVLAIESRHEMWRDEVRAWSLAQQLDPLSPFGSVRNEGHPVLWYLLLWAAHSVYPSPLVLPGLSVAVAFAAVALFLFRSPFPAWIKLLFIFGYYPLYEYSVIARNYGISMLLMFLVAAMYGSRREHPIRLGVVLALLANTNAHSILLTAALAVVWSIDVLRARRNMTRSETIGFVVALAVSAAGIFAGIATVRPDETSTIVANDPGPREVIVSLAKNAILPDRHLNGLLAPFYGGTALVIWALALGLIHRLPYALALGGGFVVTATMSEVVYTAAARHQGVAVMFALTLYWMLRSDASTAPGRTWLEAPTAVAHRITVSAVLPVPLIWMLWTAWRDVGRDVRLPMSSSSAFAAFLESRPEYRDAILIGEPDYRLESMPYYVRNDIYVPREGRFSRTTKFTTANRKALSLDELLDIAESVQRRHGRPVLIALGYPRIWMGPPYQVRIWYRRRFTWSPEQVERLQRRTRLVRTFAGAVSDENYQIRELLPREPATPAQPEIAPR